MLEPQRPGGKIGLRIWPHRSRRGGDSLPQLSLVNASQQWQFLQQLKICDLGRLAVRTLPAVLLVACRVLAAEPTNLVSFGFTGPEIFPIDNQISQLHVADLDGDGLNDLIVVNNARAKINLLYNQTGKTNQADAAPARKLELNELPPDARFRIDSVPTDERIPA